MTESNQKRRLLTAGMFVGCAAVPVGLAVYMLGGADGLGSVAVSVCFLLTAAAALVILTGGVSSVVRPKKPFGIRLMMFGALAAGISTFAAVVFDLLFGYEGGMCFGAQCVMCVGSWLGTVCAWMKNIGR